MASANSSKNVRWSTWAMRILLCWSTLLMAASGEELASTAAVRYWESKLHGGSMPSTIQAMLSPLTSHKATQLLLHINAYLPTHAASFCEAAHIQCGPNTLYKLPADPDDANLFGYNYPKAATATAEPVHVRPASNEPDDANLFNYHYRKAATAKAEPVQPRLASGDPDDANLFGYQYRKEAIAKGGPVQAHPASDEPDDKNLFGYNYGKSASVQTLPASDIVQLPLPQDHGYKVVKNGDASLVLQSRNSKESGRASRALTSSTIREIPGVFFREEQVLVTGARIHVILANYSSLGKDERAFLPHKLAQVFPLSDKGAEGISRMLGFNGRKALQNTIDSCNAGNYESTEVSACLASVEGVVDFVSSIMGSSQPINAYDSILNASSNMNFSDKTFLVESVRPLKKDADEPSITCHDMSFPFRVLYCHYAKRTMVFRVQLKGIRDGTSHERLSVCHYDTSSWDPAHLSFTELHTQPGEAEACHWLGKSWMGQSGWVFSFA